MTSFQLLTGPVVESLGWALLHLVWQGALVAAILAAMLSLLPRRSSNARYAAACTALALLPVLATITAIRSYEAPPPVEVIAPMPITIEPAVAASPISIAPTPVEPESLLATVLSAARAYLPIIVLVWLAGVAVLATRLVVSWNRVRRLAHDRARTAAAVWNTSVARLSRLLGLRRAVRLLESAAVEVPTVIGWLRPVILLPASTLAGLSPEQIEMLLAHELAHIRRHDFFINLLQALVETLMFYHPGVWWISQRVRIERENCCDDLAVSVCGNAVQYARALTRLEELRAGVQYAAVAANGGSLIARIRRLVATPREGTGFASRWAAGAAVLAVLIALITLPSFPLFANHEEKAPPAQKQSVNPPSSEVEVNATEDHDEDMDNGDDSASDDPDVDVETEAPVAPAEHGTPIPVPAPRPAPMFHANLGMTAPMAPMAPMAAVAPHIADEIGDSIDEALDEIDVDDDVDAAKFGTSGQLTVDELIRLRSSGVTPEYIQEMRNASLGQLTLGQILNMRVQGVNPTYVRDLRAAGVEIKDSRDVVILRSMGVSADYVKQMKASGYNNLTVRELAGLRSQGVTPDYVKQMADAGYRNLTTRELIELRSQGVTTAFIKALSEAGYTKLTVRDITRLAASGVNADFIRQMSQYREKK